MQRQVLWTALAATLATSIAYTPSPISYPGAKLAGSGGLARKEGRCSSLRMSLISRRDLAKVSLLGGTAMASLLLKPQEGQCKAKRAGDGGKWARHYGEFAEEELAGFTETASGLKYKDVVVGDGGMPSPGNAVQTHYSGYLLESGNLFDSSYERGKPLSFKVGTGQVIKGWDEALLGMKVGGRRQLIIPAALAYGSRQVGPIAANSALVFYVELLAIGA